MLCHIFACIYIYLLYTYIYIYTHLYIYIYTYSVKIVYAYRYIMSQGSAKTHYSSPTATINQSKDLTPGVSRRNMRRFITRVPISQWPSDIVTLCCWWNSHVSLTNSAISIFHLVACIMRTYVCIYIYFNIYIHTCNIM